ncbi:hypothetical protein [Sphingobacterium paucimobilis]|uniref:Uncharacterized protein n=1 Tax=Sphingobacterium paucimobilis HER1398 TaxID=1346330 RepID=U2HPG3_9SPHI|nr:hypothetical protein [Sphingobacterium paucimobilis]ERJ57362.1 hypothetical protein M472_01145 [Sphingobacterium paucimobilis HER1398]
MNKKKPYVAPSLYIEYISLEESIAASSAKVTGGENQDNLHTPGVHLWGEEIDGGKQRGDY